MRTSEMLDLPREERSRFLRAIPLTREYVFGCLEPDAIHFIRRTITRCGGTWREEYCIPGLAVVATFRTSHGMREATLALVHWQNEHSRRVYDISLARHNGDLLEDLMLDETFARFSPVPALRFEVVNHLGPEVIRKPAHHPVKGW